MQIKLNDDVILLFFGNTFVLLGVLLLLIGLIAYCHLNAGLILDYFVHLSISIFYLEGVFCVVRQLCRKGCT